ncbi:hypothetical protein J2Y49_005596 [Azospirillum sp. BE72]|nr:hypothetical protein [Azospirillum sp. BE72]
MRLDLGFLWAKLDATSPWAMSRLRLDHGFPSATRERLPTGLNSEAREGFLIRGQPVLDPIRVVSLDETWASSNMTRRHGRCVRGRRITGIESLFKMPAMQPLRSRQGLRRTREAAAGRTIAVMAQPVPLLRSETSIQNNIFESCKRLLE